MCLDLHVPAPLPGNLVIVPTHRDPATALALSSRNAYLSAAEFAYATVLVDALRAGEAVFEAQRATPQGVRVADVLDAVRASVRGVEEATTGVEGVDVRLVYAALNDPEELWDLEEGEYAPQGGRLAPGKGAVLSGAVMLGRTRLIDNLVFGYPLN